MKYRCITNGFKTRDKQNPEKWISVSNGEIVECDGEYIIKGGARLCHKKSILGKYHFRKVDE